MVQELKIKLAEVNRQIEKLTPNDSYLDAVHKYFPLGMVGGSGKNTYRLNKRRENSMQKSIDASKLLCELYVKQSCLEKQISDIESGKTEMMQDKKAEKIILRLAYWGNLKVGDFYTPGNYPVKIIKKSKKSILTENNVKWTASEVIGIDAAKLII